MEIININGKSISLPSPVYILPNTIKVAEAAGTVSGKCLFPSSDLTVGDRIDHANVAHAAFALWNCAHIFANAKGWGRLFALEVNQKVKGMMPPDTEIDFEAVLTGERRKNGRVIGSARAEFSLSGKTLLIIDVRKFIGEKLLQ